MSLQRPRGWPRDCPPRPDWAARASLVLSGRPPPDLRPTGVRGKAPVCLPCTPTGGGPTSTDDDYLNVLLPITTDYGRVPRSPQGAGAGHRVGIQNLPAGGLTPLTAHFIFTSGQGPGLVNVLWAECKTTSF